MPTVGQADKPTTEDSFLAKVLKEKGDCMRSVDEIRDDKGRQQLKPIYELFVERLSAIFYYITWKLHIESLVGYKR